MQIVLNDESREPIERQRERREEHERSRECDADAAGRRRNGRDG